jgi:hypothetical protein
MPSPTANTKPDESRRTSTEESKAAARNSRNRQLLDVEAARIVDGMNRLREQKIAARSQKN